MRSTFQLLRELFVCFRRLRPHLRLGRWLLMGVTFCALLSAPLEVAGVGLLFPMLSFLQGNGRELLQGNKLHYLADWFPNRSDGFYFALFCSLVVVALILKNAVQFVGSILSARMMSRGGMNLRGALFERLQTAPLLIFEKHKAGEISAVFTVETVRTMNAMDFLLGFLQRSTIALFLVVSIVAISWRVAAALLVLVLILAAATGRLNRHLKQQGIERGNLFRRLGGVLIESFAGIRVVRATNGQAEITQGFEGVSSAIGRTERKGSLLNSMLMPVTETLGVTGAMLILIWTYYFLILSGKLEVAYLMILGVLLIRLLPLINQLHGFTGMISYNLAGVNEVVKWLSLDRYPMRPFGDLEFAGVREQMNFSDLSFRYPNGTLALDRVSFSVPAGATVAVVGASGSGKSTLASLLIRLREPTSGSIWIDGIDFWEFSASSWHQRLGVVEQEAFVFHEAVRRNICFGYPSATEAEIATAVRVAHLEDVIRNLPQGLETVVGERGMMLSGGQRQRLAIARALVRQPQLLVLDEATSALDNVSERQVQAALDEARVGRTTLVIAHRLSTVRSADMIVVLDHGRVVQTGSWHQLESQQGPFQRLIAAARDGHLVEGPA